MTETISYYVGIDPGLGGAVAVMGSGSNIWFVDAPTMRIGDRIDYCIPLMRDVLSGFPKNTRVFLEKVHAMPKNGSIGNFRMGYGFGLWLALIVALNLSHTLVTPQRWKKALMDGQQKEKDASRQRVMQLFPEVAKLINLKKHHGRADALLIAEFGRRMEYDAAFGEPSTDRA